MHSKKNLFLTKFDSKMGLNIIRVWTTWSSNKNKKTSRVYLRPVIPSFGLQTGYSTRHKFCPVHQALNPTRMWLIPSITNITPKGITYSAGYHCNMEGQALGKTTDAYIFPPPAAFTTSFFTMKKKSVGKEFTD